jgi:hypothetical protein
MVREDCCDCGIPYEVYMVADRVWDQAAGGDRWLCVGCLEDRLGRELEPADFTPLPVNDDQETDSVRLRMARGSGRHTEALYHLATVAVVDLGVAPDLAASSLELDGKLVETRCKNRRFALEVA